MTADTLVPLSPPEIAVAPAVAFGDRPGLHWLPLASLRIDESYQRPITPRGRSTIASIAAGFSWSKFQAVIVAPVIGRGLWTVIDGQHRCLAALLCSIDEVPCMVVNVPAAEAAKIFAAVNGTVTPMNILSLFKAARIAGEGWALDIDKACKAACIEPLVYPVSKKNMKPLQTLAIGTLRRAIIRHGVDVVGAALAAERTREGSATPGYFDSAAIDQAVMRHRGVALPAAAPALIADKPQASDLDSQIEQRLRRGHLPSLIAAVLKCRYADVERVKRRAGL